MNRSLGLARADVTASQGSDVPTQWLGLSTAYGIIEQSGGAICLDTAPGQGTRFDIYLPALTDPGADAP